MDSCKYEWPAAGDRSLIGKRFTRIDGPAKSSGHAKYTYDINPPGLLISKIYRSPYAHAKITAIDTSDAEKLPGVKSVRVILGVGKETNWVGDEVIAVAAESEDIAEDAVRKIKVEFEELPHLVLEENLEQAGDYAKKAGAKTAGDPAKAFSDPDIVISEGYYGASTIAHCCLESHGNIAAWTGEKLLTYSSTQSVSGLPGQFGQALREQGVDVPDKNIETICNYIGGGFGSKFSPDEWGIHAAHLAKATGKPVKLMLDRNMEMEAAGTRPSCFAKIKVAAKKDGTLVAWDSQSWGTGGPTGAGMPPLPYVLVVPNSSTQHTSVAPIRGRLVPGARRIIPRRRRSPCARSKIWPRSSTWIPSSFSPRTPTSRQDGGKSTGKNFKKPPSLPIGRRTGTREVTKPRATSSAAWASASTPGAGAATIATAW